jgi:uncharacterized protein YjiS (DUF1127 family)
MSYHKEIKRQESGAFSSADQARVLSHEEIQAALLRARVMRSQEVAAMTRKAAAAVKAGFYKLFGGLIERRKANRSIAYLNGLNDHDLRDMGLTRTEIVASVKHGPSADTLRGRKQAFADRCDDIAVEAAVRHAA